MKKVWMLYALPLLLAFGFKAEPSRWVVQPCSTVMVKGKTNVNAYNCGMSRYEGCDTIGMVPNGNAPQSMQLQGAIYLDVYRFDCFNRLMTAEMRKTLQAAKHPKLKIRFITMSRISQGVNKKDNACGVVELEIAGVRKRYPIDYQCSTGDNANTITLAGQKTIAFSDFSLKPPRKLNGMVQAKDELEVQFNLVMKKIPHPPAPSP